MKDWNTKRSTARVLAVVAGIAVSVAAGAAGLDRSARFTARPIPASIEASVAPRVEGTLADVPSLRLDSRLANATGRQDVIVRLRGPSVADGAAGKSAVEAEQSAFIQRVLAAAPSARVIGSVQLVLNAVFLDVDAKDLASMSHDVSVARIAQVGNYKRDLATTVPYIGASTVQKLGYTGQRIRVAVLDAGIDYTHAEFGGKGTFAEYQRIYGTSRTATENTFITPGSFPTAKVIGGYDFVGEAWPNGPLAPDPNPIAAPDVPTAGYCTSDCFGGHGTHVADIIGGNAGVAPGVRLYAVKVCAAYATSCSGIALVEGMEFAVDPNGDGRTNDRVDIVNMSLGSDYGQPFDDDLSFAVDGATKLGVLTVASAGNGSDKQFITGSPAAAPTALSVAQTAMPTEKLQLIKVAGTNDRGAVEQPWAPALASVLTGPIVYPDTNRLACNPFPAGSLAGQIVLVDRGSCAGSIKTANTSAAGAVATIIGFVDATAPFAFAFGGGTQLAPAYSVSLADSSRLKAAGTVVTLDPTNRLPLVGSMASTSSRGLQFQDKRIKPEIGAPGASISASSGTGNGVASFGGTSGASPMVAGSAALLKSARPGLSPLQLKQLLINSAYTDVMQPSTTSSVLPDILAPIARIGGGEVRVDRAVVAPISIVDADDPAGGGLSFGLVEAWKASTTINRRVRIENFTRSSVQLSTAVVQRYANDLGFGVTLSLPSSVTVPARGSVTVPVQLKIEADLLRNNLMNGGSLSADSVAATRNEHDGFLTFKQAGGATYTLPWSVLPRKSAKTAASSDEIEVGDDGTDVITLRNTGAQTSQTAAYSIVATAQDVPSGGAGQQDPAPSVKALGTSTVPVPAGVCDVNPNFVWEFALTIYERPALPRVFEFDLYLDTDGDGVDDYVVFNANEGFNAGAAPGRQLTYAANLKTGALSAFFFVENATNTANSVLRVCGNQIGLDARNFGQEVKATGVLFENYFNGNAESVLSGLTLIPLGERFVGLPDDVAPRSEGTLTVLDFASLPPVQNDLGVMLITNSSRSGSNGGATKRTETLYFKAPGKVLGFTPRNGEDAED